MHGSDAAHDLHRLVLIHGRERARLMVPEKQRPLVDIAAEVMADESQRIGISYTGFCLTSLPHKRLPDEQIWEKKGYRVTLWVEPGRMKSRGRVVTYGVPYGARARMILLYLQTQAVRTGSREVALGRSMRDWMERMGLAIGGETAHSLREQAARISACTSSFSGKMMSERAGHAERSSRQACGSKYQRIARAASGRIALSSTKFSGRHYETTRYLCWRPQSGSYATAR